MTRVIVLGGGLAGVAAAKGLKRDDLSVVILDRNDYHQFQPLLYQVATSQLPAEDIAHPLRTIFAGGSNVAVVTAPAGSVSFADRSVTLVDGTVYSR